MNPQETSEGKPAAPQEGTIRIAAIHVGKSSPTRVVEVVGAKAVENFIATIADAQAATRNLSFKLD